ncbi:MAG TPA: YbaK/EbsC family protein [Phycisphaerae bacterium]|nr:YbaK/EbsC family protein [Phycisphaerae bacterium]
MSTAIYESIRTLLNQHNVAFREVHHEPTYTSQQSARARGEDVRIGGKALLVRTGEVFRLFVMSAALRLDNAAMRQRFGTRRARFATAEELMQLTGLVSGSVPPFGPPILPFELYVDESILANDRIAFNAGSLTDSIIMSVADYLRIAQPTAVFRFAGPAGAGPHE